MDNDIELTEFRPVRNDKKSVFSRLPHYDILTFLSVAQRLKSVHFLDLVVSFRRHDGRHGSQSVLHSVDVASKEPLIFKRMDDSLDNVNGYKAVISELVVYEHVAVRTHPNIQRIYGLVWDTHPKTGRVLPAFVFRKSKYGDLQDFFANEGKNIGFRQRLQLCFDVGSAYEMLHSLSR
jgi:hypothetical protein